MIVLLILYTVSLMLPGLRRRITDAKAAYEHGPAPRPWVDSSGKRPYPVVTTAAPQAGVFVTEQPEVTEQRRRTGPL
jgi:hypothetical protein